MAPRPYKAAQNQGAPPGPCYNCGGNHWLRDCPEPRRDKKVESGVAPLARHCSDCGITHLLHNCPELVAKQGKTTLNYVEVIPSSSNPTSASEMEQVIPLQVVT